MTKPTTFSLDLDRAAAFLLLQILTAPGWAGEDPSKFYRAGQLLERPEFEFADRPVGVAANATPEAQKAAMLAIQDWGKPPCVIADVTEKQRDACKLAVEQAMKRGIVGASTTLNRLLTVLGIAPTD